MNIYHKIDFKRKVINNRFKSRKSSFFPSYDHKTVKQKFRPTTNQPKLCKAISRMSVIPSYCGTILIRKCYEKELEVLGFRVVDEFFGFSRISLTEKIHLQN